MLGWHGLGNSRKSSFVVFQVQYDFFDRFGILPAAWMAGPSRYELRPTGMLHRAVRPPKPVKARHRTSSLCVCRVQKIVAPFLLTDQGPARESEQEGGS
jgi:hypothetical protein